MFCFMLLLATKFRKIKYDVTVTYERSNMSLGVKNDSFPGLLKKLQRS